MKIPPRLPKSKVQGNQFNPNYIKLIPFLRDFLNQKFKEINLIQIILN
jgi:hypothetical protein